MNVSAQYAETHFPDVVEAAEKGEEIVIARPGRMQDFSGTETAKSLHRANV